MTDTFKAWVEPKVGKWPYEESVRLKCPNCGTEGTRVNREMCLECGVVFRVMAEKQRAQVEVGKELAKIIEWLAGNAPWPSDMPSLQGTLQRARDCGLLEE